MVGWSWRRSSSFGPFRLNFSKSGLGISAGVRGARLSVGPRGTYVNVGAGGFRYSHRLAGPGVENRVSPSARPGLPSAGQVSPPGQSVEAIAPAQLIDTSSDALLEEIRRKQQIMGVLPVAIGASVIGFIAFLLLLEAPGTEAVKWGMLTLGILGLVCLPRAAWMDRRARLVRVHYVFDFWGKRVQESLERLLQVLERGHAIWAVNSENVHGDWKRNAGAGTSVTRRRIQVGWGAPAFIETNARIGFLNVAGTRLYLFPDRLLILGNGGVRAVPYEDLSVKAGTVSFREEGGVPADAKVTGKTWRYLNKSGGPDRRFNNNYQIPVVSYGTLGVSAPSGLRLSLQTSAESLATDSAKLVRDLQSAVCDLERQRASSPQQESLPAFTEEPAPLSRPSVRILKPIADVLAFHWFDALPGWASPIAWGLLLSLPAMRQRIVYSQGSFLRRFSTARNVSRNRRFFCGLVTVPSHPVSRLHRQGVLNCTRGQPAQRVSPVDFLGSRQSRRNRLAYVASRTSGKPRESGCREQHCLRHESKRCAVGSGRQNACDALSEKE